jgi:hypothetical protein
MTDMGSGQAQISKSIETTASSDAELLAFLVPPPQPRWKTALYVVLLGVVVASIVFVSTSGLVVPRVQVTMDSWQNTGKTRVLQFQVHNSGHFTTRLESLDASSKGLSNAHAFLPKDRTIAPGETISVPVVVTIADCDTAANSSANSVRLRMTNGAGVAVTHDYDVSNQGDWVDTVSNDCQGAG